jgi:hypothetical protein
MALIARISPSWQCDVCSWEWFAASESGPRQCPKCGSRKWNNGMVRKGDLTAQVRRAGGLYSFPFSAFPP